jgi:hypothetical protein
MLDGDGQNPPAELADVAGCQHHTPGSAAR